MTASARDVGDHGELVLAIDGGGSKTDVALLDSAGRLRAHARGGRSQFHYLGVDGCVAVLGELLRVVLARAGCDPQARPPLSTAQVLIAGIDVPEELTALRSALQSLDWTDRLVVGNDTEALLRAGTDRGWGVAVVCGAGVNCLGLAPDGREARFASFGVVSGDWGGGGDIGVSALGAAVRAQEGRAPVTELAPAVAAHFGLADPLSVARAFHLGEIDATRLGELAPLVLELGERDEVAAGLLTRLVEEVVAFSRAALHRLGLTDADPDLVLGGGVLRAASPATIDAITREVRATAPAASVRVTASEPIVGAALLALDAVGAVAGAHARARAELDAVGRDRRSPTALRAAAPGVGDL